MNNIRHYGASPFRAAVIHGGPGAAGDVEPVARRLGRIAGVLEPLQSAMTLEGQVEELRGLLTQHGAWPMVLIGHSWGAWLSTIVAARHPALVRKLILVGSGPFASQYVAALTANRLRRLSPSERAEYIRLVDSLNEAGNAPDEEGLVRLGTLARRADTFDALDSPDEARVPEGLPPPAEIYRGVWPQADALRNSGAFLQLAAQLRCPVLAIHGDCDPSPADGIREPLAARLAEFRMIVLEKCGHVPWRERHAADRFYAILEKELRGE